MDYMVMDQIEQVDGRVELTDVVAVKELAFRMGLYALLMFLGDEKNHEAYLEYVNGPREPKKETRKEEKYLVSGVYENDDCFSRIMSAQEIFNMMDKEDCFGVSISVWRINGCWEAPVECQFLGKWVAGGAKDPQRMEIRSYDRGIEAVGYGTEH